MMQKQPHPMTKLTMRMLPFSDAVSDTLPFGQLMRLSLFQAVSYTHLTLPTKA